MRVECAVLCDGASVREGLLHILGAGITASTTPELPAHLDITFAFRVVLEVREQRSQHVLRLRLIEATGDPISQLDVNFELQEGEQIGDEEAALTVAVPLSGFVVTHPVLHLLEATLDQTNIVTIPFRVILGQPPAELAVA